MERTGGSMLPRGIGCGATRAVGAAGAVSAQNQPILNVCREEKSIQRRRRQKYIGLKRMRRVAEIIGEKQFRAGSSSSSL